VTQETQRYWRRGDYWEGERKMADKNNPKAGDLVVLNTEKGKAHTIVLIDKITYSNNFSTQVHGKQIRITTDATYDGLDTTAFFPDSPFWDKVLKHNATEEDLRTYAAALRIT
jgi:hypothetical protein